MKSLSELADEYERWAAQDEATITRIMSSVHGYPTGVREAQLLQASLLAEEARGTRIPLEEIH